LKKRSDIPMPMGDKNTTKPNKKIEKTLQVHNYINIIGNLNFPRKDAIVLHRHWHSLLP